MPFTTSQDAVTAKSTRRTRPRRTCASKSSKIERGHNHTMKTSKTEYHSKFPIKAIEVLQSWIDKHSLHEYPSSEEKQRLAEKSGLSIKQISTWFSNARNRHRSPVEDWLARPSKDEAASEAAIEEAVKQLNTQGSIPGISSVEQNNVSAAPAYSPAPSAYSAFSQCGEAVMSGPPRRGRKKFLSPAPSLMEQRSGSQVSLPMCPDGLLLTPPASNDSQYSPINMSPGQNHLLWEPERHSALTTASIQPQYQIMPKNSQPTLLPTSFMGSSSTLPGLLDTKNALLPDSSGQLNLPWESELSSAFRTASSIRYPSSQVQIGHQAKNEGMGTADSSTHLRPMVRGMHMRNVKLEEELRDVRAELVQTKQDLADALKYSDLYRRQRDYFATTVRGVTGEEACYSGRSPSQLNRICTKRQDQLLWDVRSPAEAERNATTNYPDLLSFPSSPSLVENTQSDSLGILGFDWSNDRNTSHSPPVITSNLPADDSWLSSDLELPRPLGMEQQNPSFSIHPAGQKRHCPSPCGTISAKKLAVDHHYLSNEVKSLGDTYGSALSNGPDFEHLDTIFSPSARAQTLASHSDNHLNSITYSNFSFSDDEEADQPASADCRIWGNSISPELNPSLPALSHPEHAIPFDDAQNTGMDFALDHVQPDTNAAPCGPVELSSSPSVNKAQRIQKNNTLARSNSSSKPPAQFQCTFCHRELQSGSWKRHEESTHLPRFHWVCQATPPDDYLLTCHRASECRQKPLQERIFTRKDHLKQHWKTVHQCELDSKTAELWKIEANYKDHKWKCGFCGMLLENWNARAKHIGKHFREGSRMDSWDSNRPIPHGESRDLLNPLCGNVTGWQ